MGLPLAGCGRSQRPWKVDRAARPVRRLHGRGLDGGRRPVNLPPAQLPTNGPAEPPRWFLSYMRRNPHPIR